MTSDDIRQSYIDFFVKQHGHTFVPSSSVVPHDDPTLLFTNAGMNQFKPIFLGTEKRAYTRAVNTQKCIRAGGKHNDLDDVGRSRRHHTFFEMLGNWSFGDYFKEGAIKMAWQLLVDVWKLDPTRLHVTVHEGDEANGVPRDDEAADIWHKVIGVPRDRIHYGGKDNFWEMGETGPCGPCTEIFYDRTPDKSGGKTVLSGEDPRVMEIWNNVFIQYNRNPDRSLTKLPAQHVDTGMGFERICQVIQGKNDNYAIDLFEPIFKRISALSGQTYGGLFPESDLGDRSNESKDLKRDIAFRVIADHARMATFSITDGAMPGNKGRDAVVRSVIRRAFRFGYQEFGLRKPFLFELVHTLSDCMGGFFPELRKDPKRVAAIIESEEKSFLETIERGLSMFEQAYRDAVTGLRAATIVSPESPSVSMKEQDDKFLSAWEANRGRHDPKFAPVISARDSFDLHTTFGFPIDLQEQMALERGVAVDRAGYAKLFEEFQKKSGEGRKSHVVVAVDLTNIAKTDDKSKYMGAASTGKIVGTVKGTDVLTTGSVTSSDAEVALLLATTNFYGEQGGQVGDTGTITTDTGTFGVEDTQRRGDHVLHVGTVTKGSIAVGQTAKLTVDSRRNLTQQNHTTTHVTNWALREVLGNDVQQKGSLVDPDKLRFDFSHGASLTDEQACKVEELVNAAIAKDLKVDAKEVPQEQALKINGLRAVFGEKYPPMVRVVSIGATVDELLANPANPKWREFSIEFCGGTHLRSIGEAKRFVLITDEPVSKGVRRLVGYTGANAEQAQKLATDLYAAIAKAGSVDSSTLSATIQQLQKQAGIEGTPLVARRRAQQAIADLQARLKAFEKEQKKANAVQLDVSATAADLVARSGGKAIVARIDNLDNAQMLALLDSVRAKASTHAFLLASVADGKVQLLSAVSDDLIAKGLKAGDWIRDVAKATGGGGGGRPNMAQAGGKDPSKVDDALSLARDIAAKVL
jgi:alanyl-tRNA synthetase